MIKRSRRDALVLLAVMGGVSTLAAMDSLVPLNRVAGEEVNLEQMFPQRFDGWRVDEATRVFVRPAQNQGKQYGIYDQVLEREYVNDDGQLVMLSVAYGSEQSSALQLHRPEICYPYNGYQVLDVRRATLTLAGRPVPVTKLQADMPGRLEPVTYWTVLGGEPVADERGFRWRIVRFALHRELPDGMLVRLSSINMDPKAAFELQRRFADSMLRAMSPDHRAQVIGSASRS